MKYKTTAKAIREEGNAIAIGYCDGCHLFRNHEPIAYTCGVYGWNFDVYTFYPNNNWRGINVCTGYRGMVGCSPKTSIRPYEEKARAIWDDWNRPYEERKEEVEALLNEWLSLA